MADYYFTTKFTIVPSSLTDKAQQGNIMREMFTIEGDETICSTELPQYDAVLLYAAPSAELSSSSSSSASAPASALESEHAPLPLIIKHIATLSEIKSYNKAAISFSKKEKTSYIVIGEGNKLIIANPYHTPDFISALYFLLKALTQRQMNRTQTSVAITGDANEKDMKTLEELFKNVIDKREK